MEAIELTYGRAFKIWWSYVWRSVVLTIPVMFALLILLRFILPFPQPGEGLGPGGLQAFAGRMFVAWLIIMTTSVLLQVQAMRWMLQTKWSDFRLSASRD